VHAYEIGRIFRERSVKIIDFKIIFS